jgi:hypothetical protein
VWCAIVGSRKNEVRFLDAGGLFALLDVLEVAPVLLKRQIIGCIADLMQYRKAAKLFSQWNSQVTMKGALKILLELWQNEQENSQSVGPNGVLRDLNRPLNPLPLPNDGLAASANRPNSSGSDSSQGSSRASARIVQARNFADNQQTRGWSTNQTMNAAATSKTDDEAGAGTTAAEAAERQDCRAKIYAILKCVQFESTEALTIPERQHMELVRLYTDSVQLETWIAVKERLEARKIEPVSADLQWIEDSIREGKEKASYVQSVQQKLADERYNEDHSSLHRFYDDIRTRAQFRRGASGKDAVSTPLTEMT